MYEFLRQFVALDIPSVTLVAVLVGGAAYGIIQGFDALVRNRPNSNGVGLDPNLKYWGAVILCILLPVIAYLLVTLNDARPLTPGGIFLAAGVAFLAATTIHWVSGGSQKAEAAHEQEKAQAAVGIPPTASNDTGLS